MRVAVILVWRPKYFPTWNGRCSAGADRVPPALAFDRAAAPYTAVHLASLLPRDWEITLVHEMARDVDLDLDVDAVFLSTMDYCAPHAYWLAQQFRCRGVRVIVGGLFPTLDPNYFAPVADAVVVGEAEPVMPRLIEDLRARRLQSIYRAQGPADLTKLPVPRYDLVETSFRMTMGYEATRGCPFACTFCVLSALSAPYRWRPVANVVRDIQAIPASWSWRQRKLVTFWDNNLGANRAYFRELCEALIPLKRFWSTQTSIDTVTAESARLMGRSGCRYLYIGLESLASSSLQFTNKKHNRVQDYRRRIGYLHDNGIAVMSIFLLGLDGDTMDYLRELPNLVDEVGVDVPVFSLPVPIEGTPFHSELDNLQRLLPGNLLHGSDGVHVVFKPKHLSAEELEMALATCMRRSYSWPAVAHRVIRRAASGWSCFAANVTANCIYMRHQRALADAGLRRIRARASRPDLRPGVEYS